MIKVLKYILVALNVLAVLMMLVCAYSVYLHPVHYPNWSYFGMLFPIPLIVNVAFFFVWIFRPKTRYFLIPLAGMFLCMGAIKALLPINPFQGDPDGRTIKVLSYNVMMFDRVNADEAWEDNEILRYILDSEADIVCLQEATSYVEKEVVKALISEKYDYIEICMSDTSSSVILSKFPVVSSAPIDIPSESNSSCAFTLLVGEDTMTVINNHLESYKLNDDDKEKYKEIFRDIRDRSGKEEIKENFWLLEEKLAKANQIRAVQADSIDAFVQRCTSKYIISCGDFNDCPISYVHRVMCNHLRDAYTESGNGLGLSYHRSGMYFRIDNILVSENIKAYHAKVDDSVDRSDHYPILCTLEL